MSIQNRRREKAERDIVHKPRKWKVPAVFPSVLVVHHFVPAEDQLGAVKTPLSMFFNLEMRSCWQPNQGESKIHLPKISFSTQRMLAGFPPEFFRVAEVGADPACLLLLFFHLRLFNTLLPRFIVC